MGIPQAASVGREGALAQGPCDAFSSSLPPLCTPWAGKKPKSPPGPLSSVDATLSACPSPGPLSSANVILSACPPPGPCSDDGRIHVRFDGLGKCLGDATILVYTLPHSGVGPSTPSYSFLHFPPPALRMVLICARLDPPTRILA